MVLQIRPIRLLLALPKRPIPEGLCRAAAFATGLDLIRFPVVALDPACGARLCRSPMAARSSAHAQGKLDARYTATLAGIPLGKGAWVIDVTDIEYVAAASGMTTGLVRVFTGGQGSGASRGGIVSGNFAPASYSASISTDKKTEEISITLNGGNVKEYSITPESPLPPKAIPVTDAHRRNVIDPMTASLVRAPGKDDLLMPESCKRHMAVFDGRIRYDLDFAYKRMDKVKADKGYAGPGFGLRGLFLAGRGPCARPRGDQIPDRAARHGSVAGADRRHARAGAVPVLGADAAWARRAGGDAVHLDAAAVQGEREDAIRFAGAGSYPRNSRYPRAGHRLDSCRGWTRSPRVNVSAPKWRAKTPESTRSCGVGREWLYISR